MPFHLPRLFLNPLTLGIGLTLSEAVDRYRGREDDDRVRMNP